MLKILLGRHWDGIRNLRGWWMSEKLDGWRAYWTGSELRLRDKKTGGLGRVANAPEWWLAGLPRGKELDGELWMGRGTLPKLRGLMNRKQAPDDLWRGVQFAVFDAPSDSLFEGRYLDLLRADLGGYAFPVQQRRCLSTEDARQTMAAVVAGGGEGLMLRKRGSAYERCRSYCLLKVKPRNRKPAAYAGGIGGVFGPGALAA